MLRKLSKCLSFDEIKFRDFTFALKLQQILPINCDKFSTSADSCSFIRDAFGWRYFQTSGLYPTINHFCVKCWENYLRELENSPKLPSIDLLIRLCFGVHWICELRRCFVAHFRVH